MQKNELIAADQAEKILYLPSGWLKLQAKAGRVPHLRVNDEIFVHLQTVKLLLLKQAKGELSQGAGNAKREVKLLRRLVLRLTREFLMADKVVAGTKFRRMKSEVPEKYQQLAEWSEKGDDSEPPQLPFAIYMALGVADNSDD